MLSGTHRWRLLALVPLVSMLLGSAPASAEPAAFCAPDEVPTFGLGLADLKQAVGAPMGEPIECEHPSEAPGERLQQTSTGMAFVTRATNTTTFTDGYQRWTLSADGLLYQVSPDAVPQRQAPLALSPSTASPAAPVATIDGADGQPLDTSEGQRSAMAPWVRSAACPILYTHEVPSRTALRRLLDRLLAAGYRPTSLAAVDAALAGLTADVPPGCLVLTFDDALYSQYQNALPVLAELGLPAVFFVMPGFADGVHRYMGDAELRAVHGAGHEVEAHTCNHARLPSLARSNPSAFEAEVVDCKRRIEAITGAPSLYLAYPYGATDATVIAAVSQAGYRAAFTTRASALLRADQPYLLPRIRYDVGEDPRVVLRRIRAAGG